MLAQLLRTSTEALIAMTGVLVLLHLALGAVLLETKPIQHYLRVVGRARVRADRPVRSRSAELLRAYLCAPLGVVPFFTVLSFTFHGLSRTGLQEAIVYTFIGLISSYLLGSVMLPAFFVFERIGWRGWQFYVPTGTIAGVLTAFIFKTPAAGYFLIATASTCNAVVFSLVLGRCNTRLHPTAAPRVEAR